MVLATNLGFPRIGTDRELKKAVESYWKGKCDKDTLLITGKELRFKHWQLQKNSGLSHIPSNDFSFYDQILDMICTLGAVPKRYDHTGGDVDLDTYFAMARGRQTDGVDVTAMEMTKWFDTNYHYIVPEFEEGMEFSLSSTKVFDQFEEAKAASIDTRPVLVGPVTLVSLGKSKYEGFNFATTVDAVVSVYAEILKKLSDLGAEWVQIDEPILCLDLSNEQQDALKFTYERLSNASDVKILLATYFETLRENNSLAFGLPVDGVHIDLCRGAGQANTESNDAGKALDEALAKASGKVLSVGVVDGRNIWKNDLRASIEIVQKAVEKIGADNVFVAPSCSFLHAPVDLDSEQELDQEIKNWLAFAKQKCQEIAMIANGVNDGTDAICDALAASDAVRSERQTSERIHNADVKERIASISEDMKKRKNPFSKRQQVQRDNLQLPLFPTTSIGSFPQTQEIRKARAMFKKGQIDDAAYEKAMKDEIKRVVDFQMSIDMDVLVHGEAERNDMVEYFGEQLDGFTFTKKAWVQSYGSRCVKPPIIYGDVSRSAPMTTEWAKYAQSLTEKPMKGMLTGPVNMLQWSFVRDDQPRSQTTRQIALAMRDEVADLEEAGIKIIQIDEAALREGLPLRRSDWQSYLDWSIESFRLASSVARDETQIHTHMCYSEFNDIIDSIGNMDADVISIETSRSAMELLDAFVTYKYPNEIGPGVYDIHSPRVPRKEEMVHLLGKAEEVLDVEQIWVNPDCGLKTRGWAEVEPALRHMVEAAKELRVKQASKAA